MKKAAACLAGWVTCVAGIGGGPGVFSTAAGRAAQQPAPVFRGGTDLVQLDISVLDKSRQPVRGLTQADFTILEDGTPQTIAAFSAVDLPDVVTTGAPWLREVAADVTTNEIDNHRIFVLVLDDATIPPKDLWANEAVSRGAELFIDRMRPDDLATVVFTRESWHGQGMTNDHAKLKRAARRFTRQGNDPVCADYVNSARALQQAAEFLAIVPQRRKTLIYFSAGMKVDIGAATVLGPIQDRVPAGVCGGIVAEAVKDAFRAAQRSNVNFHGVDPAGLRVGASFGSPSGLAVEFLQTVSANTGGHAIVNTNDFEPGVTQIFRENSSYYLLGYQPANVKADGTIRRLDVKVNRPDVEVRTRRNYIAPKAPPAAGEKAPPAPSRTDLAMAEILPKSDLPLRIAVAPFATKGGNAVAAIVLGLRQPLQPARIIDDIRLVMRAFTPDGIARGTAEQTIPITVAPPRRGSDFTRYEALATIVLKPGRYELRVSVQSGAFDKAGSVYTDVDVPDFEKLPLALSGVVLSATPGLPIAPAEALAGIVPVIPTAEREFLRVERVSAFLRVYQGGKAKLATVSLTTRIVDAQGSTVFEESGPVAPEQFGSARAADTRLVLPLNQLASGDYLLSFEAGLDKTAIRRDVRFRVK